MIPKALSELVEKQAGNVRRTNVIAAHHALKDLGVQLDCEFAEFYSTYKITLGFIASF